ncbi:MAG TPA: Tat pathway signal protein [Caulobacteraceae bacterium]|jgi:hypothetical protein|nr:Tat pathway signal protein [Caulobacteraceae bacterium]
MHRRALIVAAVAAAALPALAHAADEHKKGGGETFVQMETLAATITRPDGRRGVMTVEVGIDAQDGGLHTRVTQSVPLLRSAYSDLLRTYAAGLSPGSLPNADYLSREFQRLTDQTLGRPGAKLLLGTILVN